jgi:hypothetical protein
MLGDERRVQNIERLQRYVSNTLVAHPDLGSYSVDPCGAAGRVMRRKRMTAGVIASVLRGALTVQPQRRTGDSRTTRQRDYNFQGRLANSLEK